MGHWFGVFFSHSFLSNRYFCSASSKLIVMDWRVAEYFDSLLMLAFPYLLFTMPTSRFGDDWNTIAIGFFTGIHQHYY
jgi:hypothetical protein